MVVTTCGESSWRDVEPSKSEFVVFLFVFGFSFSSTDSISSSSVIDKSREKINAKTPKRQHDGKPQVLDSARKYCEPIGQKWYQSCVNRNDIITGGIVLAVIDNNQYIYFPLFIRRRLFSIITIFFALNGRGIYEEYLYETSKLLVHSWSPCALLFITLHLVFYDIYIRELCYFVRRPWCNSIFLFKFSFLSILSGKEWSVTQLLDKRHLVKFTAYKSTIAFFFSVFIMSTSCLEKCVLLFEA